MYLERLADRVRERFGWGSKKEDPVKPDITIAVKPRDREKDFARIDQVLAETGLVSRLHDLYAKNGMEEIYIISDAYEMATGFPVRVLTRTILSVSPDKENDLYSPHAGLVISEINSLGGFRTMDIQMGLDEGNIEKLALRMGKIPEEDAEKAFDIKPYWWRLPYEAVDITRPDNLEADSRYFGQGSEIAEQAQAEGALPLEVFIWGAGSSANEKVTSFVIQQQIKGVTTRDPEKEEKVRLAEGFANLNDLIKSLH